MSTIIDALVVELELDATPYKKSWKDVDQFDEQGQKKRQSVNKQNDKEQRERERKAKSGALDQKKIIDLTTSSVAGLARAFGAAFLGFESLAGGIKYLGDLNNSQAALGRTATRLGVDPATLNIWGKAVELAGGKAEDATTTIADLAKQFSTLKTVGGAPGPLLQLLMQRGVAFRDAKGEMLDIGVILRNLSKSMAGMSAQDRSATLARAGVAQGLIDLFNETQDAQSRDIAKAIEFNNATKKSVEAAEQLKGQWQATGQAVDKVGQKILDVVTPATQDSLGVIEKVAGGHFGAAGRKLLDIGGDIAEIDRAEINGVMNLYDKVFNGLGNALGSAIFDLYHDAPSSRAARNNNPGNIKAVGDQARDAQGFRIFATLAEGIEAMQKNVERKIARGDNTIAKLISAYEGTDTQKDPKTTAAYIASVARTTGIDANAVLTADKIPAVLAAMARQESGLADAGRTPHAATPNATGSTSTSNNATTSNQTTVTAPITINPPVGADPAAIGAATASALQRKITVAQSNAGQS